MNTRFVWNFEIDQNSSLILPKDENAELNDMHWEARFFWSDKSIITLSGLTSIETCLSNYEIKQHHDIYQLIDGINYNLKIRHDTIIYKPLLKITPSAIAFGKKIRLEEQAPTALLPGLEPIHAERLLELAHKSQRITVNKEALLYKFPTKPKIKLELAKLSIAKQIYFSVNIESRSLQNVNTVSKQLINTRQPLDYVTFLKQYMANNNANFT